MSHLKTCAVKKKAPKGRRVTPLAALIALDPAAARATLSGDLTELAGNVSAVAARHDVSRQTLYRYLAELDLVTP